jgi:hypothetical protein
MDKTASNVAVEAGRALLLERLALCTPEQQAFYHKIYPGGPRFDQLDNALDQVERTIRKNTAKVQS